MNIQKRKVSQAVYIKQHMGQLNLQQINLKKTQKKIEELIRQREENIALAGKLKDLVESVENKEKDWKDKVKEAEDSFPEDIIETLNIVGKSKGQKSQNYQDAMKLLHARINNLESNLHIEIDMERIEDRSKALSYIGIEVADALKSIPTPVEETRQEINMAEVLEPEEVSNSNVNENVEVQEKIEIQNDAETTQKLKKLEQEYVEQTTFEQKPSLWQRIKNSKLVRTIRYIMKIKVVLDYPALPEGNNQN